MNKPHGVELLTAWVAEQQAETAKAMATPQRAGPVYCPLCQRELGAYLGRLSGRFIIQHFSCSGLCRAEFCSWYGDDQAEAVERLNAATSIPESEAQNDFRNNEQEKTK